jgi:hypothetical protein
VPPLHSLSNVICFYHAIYVVGYQSLFLRGGEGADWVICS